MLRFLSKKPATPAPPPIKPGEKWRLRPLDGDPWLKKRPPPVTVLDVKDGWVRYDMGGGPFRDERKSTRLFMELYERD